MSQEAKKNLLSSDEKSNKESAGQFADLARFFREQKNENRSDPGLKRRDSLSATDVDSEVEDDAVSYAAPMAGDVSHDSDTEVDDDRDYHC